MIDTDSLWNNHRDQEYRDWAESSQLEKQKKKYDILYPWITAPWCQEKAAFLVKHQCYPVNKLLVKQSFYW